MLTLGNTPSRETTDSGAYLLSATRLSPMLTFGNIRIAAGNMPEPSQLMASRLPGRMSAQSEEVCS